MTWPASQWIDLALVVVLAISVVVGLLRGVTLELMSLAGWFAAWFGGNWLEPWVAPLLPFGPAGSALNRGAAFACSFMAILVVWGLLSKLVSLLVHATPLRPIDRVLGAGFGVVRGILVLLVAATLVAWTPAGGTPAWRESRGGQLLASLLQAIMGWLPADIGPPAREERESRDGTGEKAT